MTPNELLFWLSARRSGSWGQFRSAVEEILPNGSASGQSPTVAQRLRFNLQQLAHVEFYSADCEDGWRVTAPVLAVSTQSDGHIGVLTGARLPSQLAQFRESFSGLNADIPPLPEQPDVVAVRALSEDALSERARSMGLPVQLEAPLAILSVLPSVLQLEKWHGRRAILPKGREWQVSIFEIAKRHYAWKQSSVTEAAKAGSGLFRFTKYQRAWHYLRLDGQTFEVGGQVAKLFLLAKRRKQVMRYSACAMTLNVPAICRPPLPVDRALILCSGRLPAMDQNRGSLTYTGITEDIAGHAAAILSQNNL